MPAAATRARISSIRSSASALIRVRGISADANREPIADQVADAQLVPVAPRPQDLHLRDLEGEDLLGGRAGQGNRLPGDALAVLEARVAEIARPATERVGQPLQGLQGRQVALLELEIDVLAFAAGRVKRHFFDHEVLEPDANPPPDAGDVVREIGVRDAQHAGVSCQRAAAGSSPGRDGRDIGPIKRNGGPDSRYEFCRIRGTTWTFWPPRRLNGPTERVG